MPRYLFSLCLLIGAPFFAFADGVGVNEVMFDAAGKTDTGSEWVELYNMGDIAQDVSGWQLYLDNAGYFSFPADFIIGSKSFVTVHLRIFGTPGTYDLYDASAAENMGNTAGSVALFSGGSKSTSTIKSFVQWGRAGETWEADAAKAGLWTKGMFIDLAQFTEGNSIGRAADGVSGSDVSAWKIFVSPTPGALNTSHADVSISASSTTPSPAPVVLSSSVASRAPFPTISVSAGDDRVAVIGSEVEFSGHAFGLAGAPLDTARFWWNFGDGETREGRVVGHIFRLPGKYTVGLHVSSGEYAGSDYMAVTAVPNKIIVSNVIEGEEGFIQILNESDYELDIEGWSFEDARGGHFVMPPRTRIGARAKVSFANAITKLSKEHDAFPLVLRYLNGVIAFQYTRSSFPAAAAVSVSSASAPIKRNADTMPRVISMNENEKRRMASASASSSLYAASAARVTTDRAAVRHSDLFFMFAAVGISIFAAAGFLVAKILFLK